jgi:hypothetical protein
MKTFFFTAVSTIVISIVLAANASAQPASDPALQRLDGRVEQLETRVNRLSNEVRDNVSAGGLAVLFGGFCALWAQNTGRNAWLWFFLGLIFSVFSVLVLLYKNSTERHPT